MQQNWYSTETNYYYNNSSVNSVQLLNSNTSLKYEGDCSSCHQNQYHWYSMKHDRAVAANYDGGGGGGGGGGGRKGDLVIIHTINF